MTGAQERGRHAGLLLAGFGLWALAFVHLYGTQALGCKIGWNEIALLGVLTLHRALLVALFAAYLAGQIALYLAMRRRITAATGFSYCVATDLAFAAFGASIFCFWGVLWLSPCS